jgi:hypothetical protein
MPGAILENLSGRKLLVLVAILIISQIICFLIGGLIGAYFGRLLACAPLFYKLLLSAPNPSSADITLASKCYDAGNYTDKWFYPRGQGRCHLLTQDDMKKTHLANQIVFAFQVNIIFQYHNLKIYLEMF